MKLTAPIVTTTLGFLVLATTASAHECPINQSVYRDMGGQGFELVFSESTNQTSKATATLSHPLQDALHRFDVVQSSGYGSVWLHSIDANNQPLDRGSLGLFFFDDNLGPATPTFWGDEQVSPAYAFIAGLGSRDYYDRRDTLTDSTPPALQDILWIHDRCQ